MKILNLYAGIGGNRRLWGDEHEVTAIECNEKIAEVYGKLFPKDKVIVIDAHEYLLDYYSQFDFIWSSPPCPTHTKMNIANSISPYKDNTKQLERGGGIKPRFADLNLYQEIIFLQHHFKGKFCVENVIAYYKPLIKPTELGGHWFWANFIIPKFKTQSRGMGKKDTTRNTLTKRKGFSWESLEGLDRELVLRNCVESEVAEHILKVGFKEPQLTLLTGRKP